MTCQRFGGLADLSARRRRVQRVGEERLFPLVLDGDRSPAERADLSAHSQACGSGTGRVRPKGVDSWLR